MDKQFDELSKSLAEGVSRREALRKFGFGFAGVLLASLGLGSRAHAGAGICHGCPDSVSHKACMDGARACRLSGLNVCDVGNICGYSCYPVGGCCGGCG